jgi:hypothetical protein
MRQYASRVSLHPCFDPQDHVALTFGDVAGKGCRTGRRVDEFPGGA